jgi:3-hydroxyisobutyrate dehydrogenase-like beta-hydroxyacid dehydrogenase
MLGRSGSTYPALLSMLPPDAVWIDMTSAAPEVAADLRAAAREHAVRYVDAAVGGSAADASCGRLSLYLGGADDDVQRASSLLRDLAPNGLKHMGGCGAGYLTKLLINQLWFGQAVIVAEALSLAIAGGLDAAVFAVALSGGPADGAFVRDYLPRMLVDDHLPTFGIDRIVEQLDALERTAAASGVQWTVSGAVADLHRRALRSVGPVEGELLAALHVMRSAVRE